MAGWFCFLSFYGKSSFKLTEKSLKYGEIAGHFRKQKISCCKKYIVWLFPINDSNKQHFVENVDLRDNPYIGLDGWNRLHLKTIFCLFLHYKRIPTFAWRRSIRSLPTSWLLRSQLCHRSTNFWLSLFVQLTASHLFHGLIERAK